MLGVLDSFSSSAVVFVFVITARCNTLVSRYTGAMDARLLELEGCGPRYDDPSKLFYVCLCFKILCLFHSNEQNS